jgi:hypothetical protein
LVGTKAPARTIARPFGRIRRTWLRAAEITGGWAFRQISRSDRLLPLPPQGRVVIEVRKSYAVGALFDPHELSRRLLRAGFVRRVQQPITTVWEVLDAMQHKSPKMPSDYAGAAQIFKTYARADFS